MTEPSLCLDWKSQGGLATIAAPNVCIVLLTYKRTGMALRTIQGVVENLDYPKELLSWYIADDGSEWEHVHRLQSAISNAGHVLAGYHNHKFSPGTPFCGKGWNTGLNAGHQQAPIILWLEDDWVLKRETDIRPYVRLLVEREDVGMVSMRTMSTGNFVETVAHNGIHYLKYLRSSCMAYSGNPLLRHIRFAQCYGYFATSATPGDLEINYDYKYRTIVDGPEIWRPVDIGGWGIWDHIGNERTW